MIKQPTTTANNKQDILNIRDLIGRIEELEKELAASTMSAFNLSDEEWGKRNEEEKATLMLNVGSQLADGHWLEYVNLVEFIMSLAGNGEDKEWRGQWYPITLVRDSYWSDYTRDFAVDIGALDKEIAWPHTCIDWKQAAHELRKDYMSAEFDGVTYWYR